MRRESIGLILVIVATLLYVLANTLTKFSTAHLSSGVIIFYRYFFSLLSILPVVCYKRAFMLKRDNYKLVFARASSGFLVTFCLVYALKHLPTAEVTLLSYTAPLFVPLLLLVIYKARIRQLQLISITIGFIGIVLVLHPGSNILHSFASIIGLAAGFFAAVSLIIIRRLHRQTSPLTIVFYLNVMGVIYSAVFFGVHVQHISLSLFGLLIALGVTFTVYQVILSKALSYLPASVVSPMLYLAVLFAYISDYFVFGVHPALISVIGFAIVLASVAINYLHVRRSQLAV